MNLTKDSINPNEVNENPNPHTDVATEDDPTIPDKEKKELKAKEEAKEKAKEEKKTKSPITPPKEPDSPNKDLAKFNQTFDKILLALININHKLNNQQDTINDLMTHIDIIGDTSALLQGNAQDISQKIGTISKLTDVNQDLANKIENMEIQWQLTMEPLTPEEITEHITKENAQYQKLWTELNNIITAIYNLKITVSKELDNQQQNPRGTKYREIYEIGSIMGRLFNVYPPQLTHFIRKKDENHMEKELMQITPLQAQIMDVSESQVKDEYAKKMEMAEKQMD